MLKRSAWRSTEGGVTDGGVGDGDGVAGAGDGVAEGGDAGTPGFDEKRRHQMGPAAARHHGSLPLLVLGQSSKRLDASRRANEPTHIRRIDNTPTRTWMIESRRNG
jgi:hypothetical protein